MKNRIYNIIYEIFIAILAIISVSFAIIDFTSGLSTWQYYVDTCIWIIFILDYLVRLIVSDNKFSFIKGNILDLVAIFPFNSALRIFRALKILKVAKLLKIGRMFKFVRLSSFILRLSKKCSRFLNTNGFKYMLLLSSSLVFIGGIGISYAEDMSLIDGIWWAFVTTTTVGYGDISPASGIGRIIACILMLVGIGLIGSLTSTITSFFMKGETDEISNDKIKMAILLYEELNDSEKEEFHRLTK